jgi:hypothetical protein
MVMHGTEVLWSSKTNNAGSTGVPHRAEPKYFGYGENKCVEDCVTLYQHNYSGDEYKLKPFPRFSGFYLGTTLRDGGAQDKMSSVKLAVPKYQSTDSPLARAGVDGAECILHVWNSWHFSSSDSSTKLAAHGSGAVVVPKAAGAGTANKYGSAEYDYYVRSDDPDKHQKHMLKDGTGKELYIPNDQISSAVVQLATDVQRWKCLDMSTSNGNKYKPCAAWTAEDGIAASFDDFNNRMNTYFSRGCPCAMKMAQCPDAVR